MLGVRRWAICADVSVEPRVQMFLLNWQYMQTALQVVSVGLKLRCVAQPISLRAV
jgi:hypothetical protein